MTEPEYLTVVEVAERTGWSESTVRRAFDDADGLLSGRTTPGGHRHIDSASVAAALEKLNRP